MKRSTKWIVGSAGSALLCIAILALMSWMLGVSHAPMEDRRAQQSQQTAQVPQDRSPIDRILDRLAYGNVAFNAPEAINIQETAIIQLALSVDLTLDELKRKIEAAGVKQGWRIRISDRMEARLTGPSFAITAITPEVQAVSHSDLTEWKWEVKPSRSGRHNLHLTLSALLDVNGQSTPRSIRTFGKTIEVEVTWYQEVSSFVGTNWQWLWAAILVPIAGGLWAQKKRSNA